MKDWLMDNILIILFVGGFAYYSKQGFVRRKKIIDKVGLYEENRIGFRLLNWWLFWMFPMWPTHSVKVTKNRILFYPSSWVLLTALVFKTDLFYEIKASNLVEISSKGKSLVLKHKTEIGDIFDLEIYSLNNAEQLKELLDQAFK